MNGAALEKVDMWAGETMAKSTAWPCAMYSKYCFSRPSSLFLCSTKLTCLP